MQIAVRTIRRRTIEEARTDKAGPYSEEWRQHDRDGYRKPAGDIASELQRAAEELESFLRARGRVKPFIQEEDGIFGYKPDSDPRVSGALDLLADVAIVRRTIESGSPDLGAIFRLGRNLETWRAMPFSDPASGEIRREANTEETRSKKLGGTLSERRARIERAAATVEAEYRKRRHTKSAIFDEVARPLGISGEGLRKAIQRLPK